MILFITLYLLHGFMPCTNYSSIYPETAKQIVRVAPYERPKPSLDELIYAFKTRRKLKRLPFRAAYSRGSGVLIRKDGVLLTAAHVVRGTSIAKIMDVNGTHYRAAVLARDPDKDLALLKIIPTPLHPFAAAKISKKRPFGWPVYAVGNPKVVSRAITVGVLTAIDPEYRRLWSDAMLDNGSSGGGLFDATNGKLISITVERFNSYGCSPYQEDLHSFLDKNMDLAG